MAGGVIETALGRFPAPAGATRVAVRPEHVSLGGTIAAVVLDVVYQGSFKRVKALANGVMLLARLPAETAIMHGDTVMLAIDARHVIALTE
jgi:hypothetical protein